MRPIDYRSAQDARHARAMDARTLDRSSTAPGRICHVCRAAYVDLAGIVSHYATQHPERIAR